MVVMAKWTHIGSWAHEKEQNKETPRGRDRERGQRQETAHIKISKMKTMFGCSMCWCFVHISCRLWFRRGVQHRASNVDHGQSGRDAHRVLWKIVKVMVYAFVICLFCHFIVSFHFSAFPICFARCHSGDDDDDNARQTRTPTAFLHVSGSAIF